MARPAGSFSGGPGRAYSLRNAARAAQKPQEPLKSLKSRCAAGLRAPSTRELSRLQPTGRLIGPGGVTIKGLYGRFPCVQIETNPNPNPNPNPIPNPNPNPHPHPDP